MTPTLLKNSLLFIVDTATMYQQVYHRYELVFPKPRLSYIHLLNYVHALYPVPQNLFYKIAFIRINQWNTNPLNFITRLSLFGYETSICRQREESLGELGTPYISDYLKAFRCGQDNLPERVLLAIDAPTFGLVHVCADLAYQQVSIEFVSFNAIVAPQLRGYPLHQLPLEVLF